MLALVQGLKDREVPIDAVGFQMHLFTKFDKIDEVADIFQEIANMDLDIYITELDISMEADDTDTQQAQVFEQVLSVCLQQVRCKALQTWGFTDMYSWRREYAPLLLDGAYKPKPAYYALQQRLSEN